jgi:CheY-like chemotaxis protein
MDDEQIVRNVLAKMFARLGCRCSFAENGNEALFLYSRALESGLPFDLVILDLTVPGGMGGKETVARLRESDPDVVAVLSSGYLNDPVMAQYTQYGFRATITKPYSLADLTTVLSTVFKKG